jgi:hypothetical protein
MADEPTCGQGLAARSTLPAKLGQFMDAVADVLAHHTKALDASGDAAKQEQKAYTSLVARHRDAAGQLTATAEEMASYRDLPMAEHDISVLTSAEAVDVFERAVTVERELAQLLRARLDEDEELLAQMRSAYARAQ